MPSEEYVKGQIASLLAAATSETLSLGGEHVSRRIGTDDEFEADLAFKPLTDLGNKERFLARFGGQLIYVSSIGWLSWTGSRWSQEGADAAVERASQQTSRAIQKEAEALRSTGRDVELGQNKDGSPILLSDQVAKHGRTSESASKLAAMVTVSRPHCMRRLEELDADPFKINVLNGTIVVRRHAGGDDPISFKPHDPQDLITKICPVVFDPEATCARFDAFLADVQPLPDVRRFLAQWAGYSLTGDTQEQKLAFLYGKGKNGKSTLVDAWGFVSGDYGEVVPIETFLDQGRGRNAGGATPDLALLPGVRFLRTSEPEKGAKLAEALIKLVTGGEPIQARNLNMPFFKFRPSFKLTMSGNYRPKIGGTDEGIWRRMILVPFGVTVAKPEPNLLAQLRAEASGILNHMLDGLRDYLENGLLVPAPVAEATKEYREDSDPLGRFLEIAVERKEGSSVKSARMFQVFCAWARSAGETEWKHRGLSMALKERGFKNYQSDVMWWRDCRLLKSEIDFDHPAPHPSQEGAEG